MRKYLDDIVFFAGGLLLVAGFYVVLPVSALFAGGVLLMVMGIMIGSQERKSK